MRIGNFSLLLLLALLSTPFGGSSRGQIPTGPETPPQVGQAVTIRAAPNSPVFSGCGGVIVPTVNSGYEQTIIDLVNQVRADNDLPPYKRVDLLDQASRYHAADMAQDGYFEHDSYDRINGQLQKVCSWSNRITSFYVPPGSPSWNYLAENIAYGFSTPESVMDGWMKSDGHRYNILSTDSWEIGVGYYQGGIYGTYWVQDFGRRNGVYPLVINREAASTDTPAVSLYIYGTGVFDEMRLRNDDGEWGGWQAFQSNLNWKLDCTAGEHKVLVELRGTTSSASSSDTIRLTNSDCNPLLGNLPDALHFTYSITDRVLQPALVKLQPLDVAAAQSLIWTVTSQGDWFNVQPQTGTTPQLITVTPDNFNTHTPGNFSGEIAVSVTDPSGVDGSPHSIDLSLKVISGPFKHTFLPEILR